MALWFPLFVNQTKIAEVSAVRISGDDTSGWCEYDWKVERLEAMQHPSLSIADDPRHTVTGKLKHQYAEGALKLMSAVLDAYYRDCAEYEWQAKHSATGGY